MKQVLFIQDRYTAGNPKLGFSNNAHNILNTFQQSVLDAQVYTLFLDELAMFGRHIDTILFPFCQKFGIEIAFVSLLGNSPSNPSLEQLNEIKKLGIKIIFLWCDNNPTEVNLQDLTLELSDLNVILDYPTSEFHNKRRIIHEKSGKYLYLWTPEDKLMFYPDKQDIEVSFIGSIRYPERAEYARKLKEAFPDIYIRGGQRESYLSPEGYASLIRRSKININFSRNMDGYNQCKGRVFEAIGSKTLLFEQKNDSTPNFFKPFENYYPFEGIGDLVDMINYYLRNPLFIEREAQKAYDKFMNNWTAKHFWDKVMDKVNELK